MELYTTYLRQLHDHVEQAEAHADLDENTNLAQPPADGRLQPRQPIEGLHLKATEDLRLPLVRHWTLYDSMFNSSYVAARFDLWHDRGRRRLLQLLAQMGCVACARARRPHRPAAE